MKATTSRKHNLRRYTCATVLVAALAPAYASLRPAGSFAAEDSLLGGRVTSSSKQALAGIPIRAHRENSTITVSVYTNSRGDYTFPGWSDLSPGSYSLAIELPDFEPVRREAVTLSAGKRTRLDFVLQSRQAPVSVATASEIAMAEPGSDDQRFMLTQCSGCHSLQWALRTPRTREDWVRIVTLMAGARNASRDTPGTRDFEQKRYIEPLAEYLASIRGPGSSDQIPFKLRPRPTGEASTRLVVTEYDLPRGGSRELYMIRGDRRFVWPHGALVGSNYVWYTDHFSNAIGRLDKRTGEVKEFTFSSAPGEGREGNNIQQERAGNIGGGLHKIAFDPQGNVVFGMSGATFRFDPSTEQFTHWPAGGASFGMDPAGNVWFNRAEGSLYKVDMKSGEVKEYKIPRNDGTYDMETDSQGRSIINVWANGKIAMFDPRTEKYSDYPTPTPQSGPRRGRLDAEGRFWAGLYWAGRLGMFDPNRGEVKEFPLLPDTKPFGPPFLAPYTTAVDDRSKLVWVTDFNSSRLFAFDMKTEKATEFFMPAPYEVRDLQVDKTAERPTLWIPAYRPPSRMVKVQIR